MNARMGVRAAMLMFLMSLTLGSTMMGQLTGRLDLSSPDYDLFTPTDWIDAASFTLKERIPAGITGYIYTNREADVYLQGIVYKQTSADRGPQELARFFTSSGRPIHVSQPSGSEFVYTLALGSLANNPDIKLSYVENKAEVDKLKDQIQSGIAALTGTFTVRVYLRAAYTTEVDGGGPTLGEPYTKTFVIPFSTPDQAKILVQVDPVVNTPNPTISVFLPAERPTLEYELAVFLVQDNARDAIQNGTPLWRERIFDGRTIIVYPPTATPLTSGNRYVVAGRSFYQSSASQEKRSIEADLVQFRYDDPSSSQASGNTGGNTSPGQDATRPDPLLTIFGSSATQVPGAIAQNLSTVLRSLEDRGWTLSQFRYNNRAITQVELFNILSQFTNANISVVE